MALSKHYGDVYDGVKHKTPHQKMLEAQEARKKALEAKEKAKETTTAKKTTK